MRMFRPDFTMMSVTCFTILWLLCCFRLSHGQREGSIRLIGGTDNSQGRVEVYANYEWGTVCHDGWYSYATNAQVVCRQLGFTDLAASDYRCCAGFGSANGAIHLDDVTCAGSEERLIDCPHNGIGVYSCSHYSDVGVYCYCSAAPECTIPAEDCPYFRTETLSVPHRECPICRCASCPSQPKCPTNCKSGQTMYYEGETCRRCKCRPQELPDKIIEPNDISLGMLLAAVVIMVVIPGTALAIACALQRKREKAARAKAKAAKEKEKAEALEQQQQAVDLAQVMF